MNFSGWFKTCELDLQPADDPLHPLNGTKYRSGRACVKCGEPAGTAWSPYYCQPCNAERLRRITASLEQIYDQWNGNGKLTSDGSKKTPDKSNPGNPE